MYDGRRHFFGFVVLGDFKDHPVTNCRRIVHIGMTLVLKFDLLTKKYRRHGSLCGSDLDMFPVYGRHDAQDMEICPCCHGGRREQPDKKDQAPYSQDVIHALHRRFYW